MDHEYGLQQQSSSGDWFEVMDKYGSIVFTSLEELLLSIFNQRIVIEKDTKYRFTKSSCSTDVLD